MKEIERNKKESTKNTAIKMIIELREELVSTLINKGE